MRPQTSRTLLWMGFLFLVLTACKDDEDEVTPSERITGEWEIQSSDVEVSINDQDYITFIQQADNLSDEEKNQAIQEIQLQIQLITQYLNQTLGSTITFNANNTYEEGGGDTGTWSLSTDGNTLTMDPDNSQEDLVFEVQTLTNTSLILLYEEEIQDDLDMDGEEDTLVAQLIIDLAK